MLVRAAHSPNIKERRDASCALFDPAGQMVMQAEHIPVHLGAMPAAVAAVLHGPPRPAGATSSTTRSAAAPTCRTSPHHPRLLRRRAASASPATAPTTPTWAAAAGLDAGRRRTLAEEGIVIPPPRAPRGRDRAARRPRCAARERPSRPPRPAWPPRGSAGSGCGSCAERHRRGALRGGLRRGARLRRAAHARLPRRAARRRRPRVGRARGTRDGDLAIRLRATVDGDALTLDFTGTPPSTRATSTARSRSPTRPATSPCASSPTPTSRRAPARTARSTVIAPPGSLLNAARPAAVVAGNVETSLAGRRPRARARSAAAARARAR